MINYPMILFPSGAKRFERFGRVELCQATLQPWLHVLCNGSNRFGGVEPPLQYCTVVHGGSVGVVRAGSKGFNCPELITNYPVHQIPSVKRWLEGVEPPLIYVKLLCTPGSLRPASLCCTMV